MLCVGVVVTLAACALVLRAAGHALAGQRAFLTTRLDVTGQLFHHLVDELHAEQRAVAALGGRLEPSGVSAAQSASGVRP